MTQKVGEKIENIIQPDFLASKVRLRRQTDKVGKGKVEDKRMDRG